MTDAIPVSRAELYKRLDDFLEALDQCKYIDDPHAYERCRQMNEAQIARIRARISEIQKEEKNDKP